MDESAVAPLGREDLVSVSKHEAGRGPSWRRIDCAYNAGVEVWGVLVELGGYYLIEELAADLPRPPGTFKGEADALTWLVAQINQYRPDVCDRVRALKKEQEGRQMEILKARADAAAAALKRARDSETV